MDLAHSRVTPYARATGASNTIPAVVNSFIAVGCIRAVDIRRSVTWPVALSTAVTVELLVVGAVDVGSSVTCPVALGASTVALLVSAGGRRLAGHCLRLWLNFNQCRGEC